MAVVDSSGSGVVDRCALAAADRRSWKSPPVRAKGWFPSDLCKGSVGGGCPDCVRQGVTALSANAVIVIVHYLRRLLNGPPRMFGRARGTASIRIWCGIAIFQSWLRNRQFWKEERIGNWLEEFREIDAHPKCTRLQMFFLLSFAT